MLDNNQLIEVKYVPIKAKHFRALGYTFNSGDMIKAHAITNLINSTTYYDEINYDKYNIIQI